jgi:hypothetical protein
MKTCRWLVLTITTATIFLQSLLSVVLLISTPSVVRAFAPVSSPRTIRRANNKNLNQQAWTSIATTKHTSRKAVDDNNNDTTEQQEDSNNTNLDDNEEDDYDFNAGFQARLQKEGGGTNLKVKTAAKRSTESVKQAVDQTKSTLLGKSGGSGLFPTQLSPTVGILVLVMVLAIGTYLSSPAPFETSTNGEQLIFGVR